MPPFTYIWQPLYAAALTELDSSKVKLRVYDSQATLRRRLLELETSPDGTAERQAIHDALFMLQSLLASEYSDLGPTSCSEGRRDS